MKKQKKGQSGNAVNYLTRNRAINKLQLKLPDFRRLCILKGIHPREPTKKTQGQNKTYYHIKDVSFLQHEPLLDKFREMRAYERKVKKARAKKLDDLAEKLAKRRPTYTLDHLVKERYPSFLDALRDLDDPLTMVHLFATLPAEKKIGIPVGLVTTARRLCLEWQAYITRTRSLRKAFISVKGIYFQADVMGQSITWLVPHQLSQILPQDVDFRVMVTFLEFYEVLLEFCNFKLYHQLGLKYPPVVDEDRSDLEATIQALAAPGAGAGKKGKKGKSQPVALPAPAKGKVSSKGRDAAAKRLLTLGEKFAEMSEEEDEEGGEGAGAGSDGEEGGEEKLVLKEVAGEGVGAVAPTDDDVAVETLFKGLIFWLGREVPREALMFVIRAFGGDVAFDGEGSLYKEKDKRITHHIVDRPTAPAMIASREYVQPQFVFDAVNFRVLPPTKGYAPGTNLPPHLSPFVDNDMEGYTPEYADTIKELQDAAAAQRAGLPPPARTTQEKAGAGEEEESEDEEEEYAAGLAKEMAGVPYSQHIEEDDAAGSEEEDSDAEEEKAAAAKAAKSKKRKDKEADSGEKVASEMAKVLMPRKTRKLYDAMQMGLAKKRAGVEELETKRAKIKADAKADAKPTRRSARAAK